MVKKRIEVRFDANFFVRCTPEMLESIRLAAERMGQKKVEWIRQAIREALRRQTIARRKWLKCEFEGCRRTAFGECDHCGFHPGELNSIANSDDEVNEVLDKYTVDRSLVGDVNEMVPARKGN